MRLHIREFKMMNTWPRRFVQKHLEWRTFQRFGLNPWQKEVLEIGCGSGYGACLLLNSSPKDYVGIDLMPEQIALARQRGLKNASFLKMDAADLSHFADESKDLIVIFGILHHVPEWKKVIKECYRVLRRDGDFYVQEPCKRFLQIWDFFLRWHHPLDSCFSLKEFENQLGAEKFTILHRRNFAGMGLYRAHKKCK